jgi:FMN phosphatase YigB (HAD superfamily)
MNRRSRYRKISTALLLSLWLSACATLPPATIERATDDLADVSRDAVELAAEFGRDRVLVVFDIDNTLLAMEQGLGSDQWYDWQKRLSEEDPCGPATVADRFAVQGAMYFASAMRPTQPDAAEQVRSLQNAGLRVIALTSRGTDYRLQTFRELRRNGYDFRRSALPPAAGWPDDFTPARGSRLARYEDGVFLTAGQHKGDMLQNLIELTNTTPPSVVVMVDDKQKNLDAVIETMTANGVAVRAWRYTGEDENVATFDPDAASRLWNAIQPALARLQTELGADNYALPPSNEACTP